MNPMGDERHELIQATRAALKTSATATDLFDKLLEAGRRGMRHHDICSWKGLDRGHPWPQRQASRLRKALDEFATGQGAHLRWRFELLNAEENDGFYQVHLKTNVPPDGVKGFWSPHFWLERENHIVITEPIFFRDSGDKVYVRHFGVNEPNVEALLEKMPGLRSHPSKFIPVHHYVSVGEVLANHEITEGLRRFRQEVPVHFTTSYEARFDNMLRDHMILTGTWRASAAIQEFQNNEERLRYEHTETGVSRKDGSQKEHSDTPGPGGAYYGLVSRIADRGTWTAKTVLACNHGPATLEISKKLFDEVTVGQLSQKMKLRQRWEGFPDYFQIIFRVTLSKHSENVGHAEIVRVEVI